MKKLRIGAILTISSVLAMSTCLAQPQDVLEKAKSGNLEAQSKLAEMYFKGQGAKKDFSQAAIWALKAAEQGSPADQSLLGNLYRTGRGVPQDFSQAVYWSRKAAEQGEYRAQSLLGAMYFEGTGVQKDLILAHALNTIAAAGAPDPERASKNRMMLERQMTQSQIAEAQHIASNWKIGQPFDRIVVASTAESLKSERSGSANTSSNGRTQIVGIGDLRLGISEKEFLALPQTTYNLQNRLPRGQTDTPVPGVRVYHSTLDLGINNFYFSSRYSVDLYFYNDELVKIVVDTSLTPRERIEETLIAKYGAPVVKSETKKDVCVNQQGNLFDWKRGQVTGEWRTGETRGVLFTEFGDCAVKDALYTVEEIKKSELMQNAIAGQRKKNILRNSVL